MQETNTKSISAILVTVLVVIALTSTAWTKTLFGRGDEKSILPSQPFHDHLNSLAAGQVDQIKTMINGENISEVLTMVQHLDLPIEDRRECNQTFVKCTADVKGGQSEAFIWMRKNVKQETCRQVLYDVDSSSTCKEKLVKWAKAKATPNCCKNQTQRKYMLPLLQFFSNNQVQCSEDLHFGM